MGSTLSVTSKNFDVRAIDDARAAGERLRLVADLLMEIDGDLTITEDGREGLIQILEAAEASIDMLAAEASA